MSLIKMILKREGNAIFGFKPLVLLSQAERWRKQAKLLNLSKEARGRLDWFIYHQTEKNVSLTCRHFGIVPRTFYKWQKLFDGQNLQLLETKSTAPKNRRRKAITGLEEERVVALRRRHIRWGKMKLARLYLNLYHQPISSWKIQYTIQKYRLYYHPIKNQKLQQKRQRGQAKKRITELKQRPFPGYLVALDTIVIWWNGTKRYILTAIDVSSKIAFAHMYTTKSSKNAADFLRRMMFLLDHEVWNTLHDNGSEFYKYFAQAVADLGLDEYWSRNHTPKDNPVCERFNRTIQEEFIALGNMNPDPVIFNRQVTEWLVEYNFVRPHQALGYATPWEYYEQANKLLPRSSSRTRPLLLSTAMIRIKLEYLKNRLFRKAVAGGPKEKEGGNTKKSWR